TNVLCFINTRCTKFLNLPKQVVRHGAANETGLSGWWSEYIKDKVAGTNDYFTLKVMACFCN
ncbi:MAG: hypothetical protein ACP5D1_13035, partial [Bacteroidales bacterium]